MYIYLSKILPLLVLPIGIVLECSFIALVLLIRNRRKSAAFFLLLAMLVLWVSSMPIVANTLMGGLERQHPAVALNEVPDSDCIVVLGGAVEPVLAPRVDVELSEAADRVYKAAALYRAGKSSVVIVAGGNQPWSPFTQTEAGAIRLLLMDWGVPDSAIMLDAVSQNTHENAINTRVLMEQAACETPLLVTSAAHMKRAVATFAMVGVKVIPVSADIRVVKSPNLTVFDFLPDAEALKMTSDAMREWVGQIVYQLRGWS